MSSFRMVDKEEIPNPSAPKRGQRLIPVPLHLAPKVVLYLAMREQGVNNSRLAGRLGVTEAVVRRLLDPRHASRPGKLQTALASLGKRLVVSLEAA